MRLFVFGSSITSSYWNGAATYYRGIYKSLAGMGHEISFAEPDIYQRQQNRDVSEVEYAQVIVYQTPRDIDELIGRAATADLVIKHSGVGSEDEVLERRVLECRSPRAQVAFWDVDAPATLQRVESDAHDAFRQCIPQYDFIFTYGGGDEVVERYRRLGARCCYPIYNALDPETHHRRGGGCGVCLRPGVCGQPAAGSRAPGGGVLFARGRAGAGDALCVGRRRMGRQGSAAECALDWACGHRGAQPHQRLGRMALNINRDSMADVGFSPPTRVFEAAGAATCLITDKWRGVEKFFEPGREILVAESAEEIVGYLRGTSAEEARAIGDAMHRRALAEHTYAQTSCRGGRDSAGGALCGREGTGGGLVAYRHPFRISSGENALRIVIFGLSISSSWGNGHATTFRALARALHGRGHRVVFFEKDVEWYASNRDLPEPDFCELKLYTSWKDALPVVRRELASADVAMVGSYFPDGIAAVTEMLDSAAAVRTFYDIDTPITVAALRERGASDYLRADQLAALDVYFSFTGGPMLGELEQRLWSAARGAAVLQLRSRTLSRVSAVGALCLRDELYGDVCSGPTAEAGGVSLWRRARAAGDAVHRGRAAVSEGRARGRRMCVILCI